MYRWFFLCIHWDSHKCPSLSLHDRVILLSTRRTRAWAKHPLLYCPVYNAAAGHVEFVDGMRYSRLKATYKWRRRYGTHYNAHIQIQRFFFFFNETTSPRRRMINRNIRGPICPTPDFFDGGKTDRRNQWRSHGRRSRVIDWVTCHRLRHRCVTRLSLSSAVGSKPVATLGYREVLVFSGDEQC